MDETPEQFSGRIIEQLPSVPGIYLLVLEVTTRAVIQVGKLAKFAPEPGQYYYLGSAYGPGGLRARLRRHLRGGSALFWHIDYLQVLADPVEIWTSFGPKEGEHQAARMLDGLSEFSAAMPDFGSSDCSCPTHLFYQTATDLEKTPGIILSQSLPSSSNWKKWIPGDE